MNAGGTVIEWTCPACGMSVPLGHSHVCFQPNPPQYDTFGTAEIIVLLERIAKALEVLAERKS
jgi:hypothetical protein